jgi:heptosyltransferase-2
VHILFVLPRWVGDAVMATPLLRAVRAHATAGDRITGVMRPVVADLLDGAGWFDAVVPYDRSKARRDPALGFRAVARRLRADRADVAVIIPNSLSSAALAWAGGAVRRIGHAGHWRRSLLTDVVRSVAPVSPPESFLELAGPLGVTDMRGGEFPHLELATTAGDERRADDVLAALFPGHQGPLVILNDNGAHGPSKSWGTDRCAALARWLVPRLPGCRVLVHCGPGDRETARTVEHEADDPAVRSLADVAELPLGLSKALYRRAAVSVSTDSGPRHIAAAFGVPTVALIGPIDPLCGRSDPRRCVEIRLDLPCSPCGRKVCPLGHQDCMRGIAPERVGQTVLGLVARSAGDRRAG